MKLNGLDLKALAAMGAGPRIAELADEIRRIRHAFPDAPVPLDLTVGPIVTRKVMAKVETPRHQRAWTAAQRRATSVRMRRYWREQRKAG